MSQHHWSIADIPDQHGKLAVVTGGNSGIGYEAARVLTAQGTPPKLLLVSGRNGPTEPLSHRPFAHLPDDGFVRGLQRIGGQALTDTQPPRDFMLGLGDAHIGRLRHPLQSLQPFLRFPAPLQQQREVELRIAEPLVGGGAVPVRRLLAVLPEARAGEVAAREVELRARIAELGSPLEGGGRPHKVGGQQLAM